MRKVERIPDVGRTWFEVQKFRTIGTRLHAYIGRFAMLLKRHGRTGCGRDISMH
jgi:hypothetical protein